MSGYAAVVFFTSQPAFSLAMAAANNGPLGIETFEESTLTAPSNQNINPPLTQGVPNGSYAAGLIQPMQVQTNSLSGAASIQSGNIMLIVPGGSRNAISHVVVPASSADSMDWIMLDPRIRGVGLNPIILQDGGTAHIQVFNQGNQLLGSFDTPADPTGINFVGIQATGSDLINRINFLGTSGDFRRAAGDNAILFVPEPTSFTVILIGALLLPAFRLRRRALDPISA
jgi:hypothetical protein